MSDKNRNGDYHRDTWNMLNELTSECTDEKLQNFVPYIEKSRVSWYCFGDYDKWKDKGFRCKGCHIKNHCINKDISKLSWSPITIKVEKEI